VFKMNILVTVMLLVYKLTEQYGPLLWRGTCVRLRGVDVAYRPRSDWTRLQWHCTTSTRSGRVHSLPWGVSRYGCSQMTFGRTCYYSFAKSIVYSASDAVGGSVLREHFDTVRVQITTPWWVDGRRQ